MAGSTSTRRGKNLARSVCDYLLAPPIQVPSDSEARGTRILPTPSDRLWEKFT